MTDATLREAIGEVLHRWELIEREVKILRTFHGEMRQTTDRLLIEISTYAADFGRVALELEQFAARLRRAAETE